MTASLYDKLKAMGIAKGYAHQIAARVRKPGLKLAIRIYKETGAKLGPIAKASKGEIATLERVAGRA